MTTIEKIVISISALAIIIPIVNSRFEGRRRKEEKKLRKEEKELSELKSKADKVETADLIENEVKGKIKPIKDRLHSVEESVRTIQSNHELSTQNINNKFAMMIDEGKRQSASMQRQADHIVKVFEEIKDISVTLAKKQDK